MKHLLFSRLEDFKSFFFIVLNQNTFIVYYLNLNTKNIPRNIRCLYTLKNIFDDIG